MYKAIFMKYKNMFMYNFNINTANLINFYLCKHGLRIKPIWSEFLTFDSVIMYIFISYYIFYTLTIYILNNGYIIFETLNIATKNQP